ncbi:MULTISPECIES: TOMM precursor leader peptide-binding protein [Streptomyces]|uniref:TOMM precursor leader peptide-binding protein n=1 Tax=Streptomyces TaxID=1883 RepID=UPI000D13A5B9|nr:MULTISPECIES: TOMM precursor leader peptide-binding protein [Streptomyces]
MPEAEARLKRAMTVIGHSPDVVELRVGVWNPKSFTITDESGKGKLFGLIAGLDGTTSHRDLARAHGVSRSTVEAVVDHLRTLDALEWGSTNALDAYLDHVSALRVDDGARQQTDRAVLIGDPALTDGIAGLLEDAQVAKIERIGPEDALARDLAATDPAMLHDGLRLAELAERFAQLRGAYVVWAQQTVNPVQSQVFNRIALELGVPWTHAAIDGPFLFVGPTIVPESSPCYECFETRVTMNLRESASYLKYKTALAEGQVVPGTPPMLAALRTTLAGHTALEAVNFLKTGSTFTIGKTLGIYLPTMEIAHHEFLRLPGCRACGSLRGRDDSSLYFDARAWINE